MAKNKWAKLWCDSFEGDSFQNCFVKEDFESPILFLLLVAKCKSMGDEHGNLKIPVKRVQKILGYNRQRLSRVHGQLCVNFEGTISSIISGETLEVSFANWAIFQQNRKKRAEKYHENSKTEDRGQRIEDRGEIACAQKSTPTKAASLPPLALLWNEYCGALPKVVSGSKARFQKAKLRYSEASHDEWVECVKRIKASPFCNGDNDRGWKADFDWLIKPETRHRVSEGKYDDKQQSQNKPIIVHKVGGGI